jgi:hypothetical protein
MFEKKAEFLISRSAKQSQRNIIEIATESQLGVSFYLMVAYVVSHSNREIKTPLWT